MGKIYEQVTLTNAVDEALARRGPHLTERPRSAGLDALVDTDAVRSVLPQTVADALGLQTHRQWVVQSAGEGGEWADVTGAIVFRCRSRETLDEAIVGGTVAVIGRTVISKLDLPGDRGGRRSASYPVRPNRTVSAVRQHDPVAPATARMPA